jgi:hypothetical protein
MVDRETSRNLIFRGGGRGRLRCLFVQSKYNMVPQQKHTSRLFWVFSCNACVQAGFLVPSLKFGRESAGSEALDFFFGIRAVLILSR